MSLLFFEGFDDDSVDRMDGGTVDSYLSGRWTGSRAMEPLNRATGPYVDIPTQDRLIVGLSVKMSSHYMPWAFLYLRPDGGGTGIFLRYSSETSADLEIHRNDGQTSGGTTELLGSVSMLVADTNAWSDYIELDITWGAAGAIVVRYGGVVVLETTGDTRGTGTGWNRVELSGYASNPSSSLQVLFDDVYIVSVDGTAPETFLGDVRAIMVDPNADGSTINWTPSTAPDNYAMVASTSESDYVETDTAGNVDLYGFESLPALPPTHPTIFGVTFGVKAGKTDTATRNLRLLADNGTTRETGADEALVGGLSGIRIVWPQDPFTMADWDSNNIDTYEFGFEARS